MPHCFKLENKQTKAVEPFSIIDEQMCEALGKPCHSRDWYLDWYNMIGLPLSLGSSWDELHGTYQDWPEMIDVITWLEDNYTVTAWYER